VDDRSVLIQVIDDLRKEKDQLLEALDGWRKRFEHQERCMEDAKKEIDRLQASEEVALERIELETAKVGITSPDCEVCGQDTYEQQQNYERIKEQLYEENAELKKENKEMRWSLTGLHMREEEDWGEWRDKALELEKENKLLVKERDTWKSWCGSIHKLNDDTNIEMKRLVERYQLLQERDKIVTDKLKEYDDKALEKISNRIEFEQAGCARR